MLINETARSPLRLMNQPFCQIPSPIVQGDILLPEQVRTLLCEARKKREKGIYVPFHSWRGRGRSEQPGSLWQDVDLDKRVIHIRRMQEQTGAITDFTKTVAGFREIPICDQWHEMFFQR